MKNKILLLVMTCFLAGIQIMAQGEEKIENTLRMMSYNIHNGIGMDGKTDYVRIARTISHYRPEVVAVQELDSATRRSHQKVVLDELARHTGMYGTFAAAIDYEGGKYGIGILSKEKPIRTYQVALPGSEEARVLLVAEFSSYYFACTHLSLTEADRESSLAYLKREAAKTDKPFFLAGDWNAHPNEPFMTHMQAAFILLTDSLRFTYPADHPKGTIDYIAMASKDTSEVIALSCEVVEEAVASDHRPVCCEVSLEK